MIVDNALYHRGKRVPLGDGDDQSLGWARVPCDPGDFQWVGIHDPSPDELDLIARTFDLHPLAVEDAGDSHQRPKLERYGDTLFLVLKTLSLAPMHGWGISQRVQQISRGVLEVNQGSLYPALQRLEKDGLITSEWGTTDNNRRARYYRLTAAGRRALGEELKDWQRFAAALDAVLRTS